MRNRLLLWTRLVLLLGGSAARPELVFRVPEVLVRTAAVSRAVGTGPMTRGNQSMRTPTDQSALTAASADYFVEHEISTADARRAAQLLKLSDVAASLPGCGTCARWEREYCRGGALLADHCCCERRFLPEPLPWLPHACLLGANRCRPLAASCAHYARLRDCCCLRDMAEKCCPVRRDVALLVNYMVRVLRGELHHPMVLAALRLRAPNTYLGARSRRPAMLEAPHWKYILAGAAGLRGGGAAFALAVILALRAAL